MRRGATLLTALSLALLAGGCGTSEEERVERVVRTWLVAYAEKDFERVCELATPEYRGDLLRVYSPRASVQACVKDKRLVEGSLVDASQVRAAKEVDIYGVEIDGERATAWFRSRGQDLGPIEFRRTADGEWRFDRRGARPASAGASEERRARALLI